MMKPSELTPAFSALLADLVPKYLDQSLYRVVNGAIPETTKVCGWRDSFACSEASNAVMLMLMIVALGVWCVALV